MAETQTDDIGTRSKSVRRRCVVAACGGLACLALYVAGIGPLGVLEAEDHGRHRKFWHAMKRVYAPVFWSWRHGPDWWGLALERYVRSFSYPGRCGMTRVWLEFGPSNDAANYSLIKRSLKKKGVAPAQIVTELNELDRWVASERKKRE